MFFIKVIFGSLRPLSTKYSNPNLITLVKGMVLKVKSNLFSIDISSSEFVEIQLMPILPIYCSTLYSFFRKKTGIVWLHIA